MASRLLTDDIAKSKKLPNLSPDALNLFFLLIPHFTVHGKMSGDPYYIKGRVCPRFDRFTPPKLKKLLAEISVKTNVKWFEVDGLWYLHSLNNNAHQPGLRKDRSGKDVLPDFSDENTETLEKIELQDSSGSSPGVVPLGSRNKEVGSRNKEGEVSDVPDDMAQTIIQVVEYLNTVLKTQYKPTTGPTRALITARINQKHTLEEFKIVIDKKNLEWGEDPKMSKYLRPETLFGSKFEGYLNQKEPPEIKGSGKTQGNWARLERRREEESARILKDG